MAKINIGDDFILNNPVKGCDDGRLKATEPTASGMVKHNRGASQAPLPCVGQSRWEKLPVRKHNRDVQVTVPVLGSDPVKTQTRFSYPLMPCHPARARQLLKRGAKRRWFKGIFAVQINSKLGIKKQSIVCGIDAGGKREAFTVQSKEHTFLNILSDAVTHVSERVKSRKELRRNRRRRKTPCRQPRFHRSVGNWLAPSIVSRWEAKLRIINFLRKIYPITHYVIEDVAAKKRPGQRRWNRSFSNLELGKTCYYEKFSELGNLKLVKGYDTFQRRNELGLKKTSSKLSEKFDSHNVDSWVLASFITGKIILDNKNVFRMVSHNFYRRVLHYSCPSKGGLRTRYGGTMSGGFKKGSVVKHPRYGLLFVGGFSKGGITLHNISTGEGERYYDSPEDYTFLYYSGWRTNWVNDVIKVPKREFYGGHSLRDPAVRAKARETKENLYGDKNFTNREGAKETCLEKYGVENVAQVKGVVEKRIQTCIQRYGKIFNWVRPDTFTKEELVELYINQGLTFKEIGEKYNLSIVTISTWINRHGIPVKNWRYSRKKFAPIEGQLLQKDYTDVHIIEARDKLIFLSKDRGVSRDNYKDGALGVPTHILEKKYGTWNKFIIDCGLEPGYKSLGPSEHVKDYFQTCISKNKVLSFYEYEKATGKPATRLKRLFSKGKKYSVLIEELYSVALKPELWTDFVKKLL